MVTALEATEPTLGEKAEKARLESLPRATEIPTTDEAATQPIEFEFEGTLHVIEIRASTYGRQKELMRGMKGDEYEDEEGRTHRVRDYYAESDLIDRVFRDWVLTINGRSWRYDMPAMATLGDPTGGWLKAFSQAFVESTGLEDVLDEARKK